MGIRQMIPMGTHQRVCVVCGYPINAKSVELTAHELKCLETLITKGGIREQD
jgi:hypothetical protein